MSNANDHWTHCDANMCPYPNGSSGQAIGQKPNPKKKKKKKTETLEKIKILNIIVKSE